MKKIRNTRQLLEEKKRLQQRKAELEKAIKYDWRDLKESARPGNIIGRSIISSFYKNRKSWATKQACHTEEVSGAASNLIKKAVTKAEEKIESWLKK